ncbi:unnamed protein product [Aureobasidium uvarum]|uniref:Small secreted protein n=1 Tax=Aureobasidium uvarum TaxID=2773716 RepID=A0A9N8PTV2_9PEZI|nr:unnamed protein product [Aureobasidium uvarum]
MTLLLLLLTFLLSLIIHTTAQSLNVSTIAVQNGTSVLECWSLASPTSGRGAQNYPLGDSSNAFIGAIPPHTYIGQAWAPSIQYSMILQGLVHLSLPNSKDDIHIQPGPLSIILVIDQKNVSISGHITEFPGEEMTLIAQFPITGNQVPVHTVLHSGPCGVDDVKGLIG